MLCFIWSNFLLGLDKFASKSVFVTKFASADLAAKFSPVNLLNSGVVIYLSSLWSVIFFSISLTFFVIVSFFTRILTLGILFSTAVNTDVVAKPPLILGISAITSFIFVLRIVLVAKVVISGILSSIFLILALYYI